MWRLLVGVCGDSGVAAGLVSRCGVDVSTLQFRQWGPLVLRVLNVSSVFAVFRFLVFVDLCFSIVFKFLICFQILNKFLLFQVKILVKDSGGCLGLGCWYVVHKIQFIADF